MNRKRSSASPLWSYVTRNLAIRRLSTGDLVRATGVHRSRLTDWRKGRTISIETARSLAAFFEVPLLEVLVGAQLITPSEVRMSPGRRPSDLSDAELLAELDVRLRGNPDGVDLADEGSSLMWPPRAIAD